MNNQIDNGAFIDTNVLLDIIYSQRKRHEKALQFYKSFKNLELCIQGQVLKEANGVIVGSSSKFSEMLYSYIMIETRHSISWDNLNKEKRENIISGFLENVKKKDDLASKYPFFESFIITIRDQLIELTETEINDFLIILPSKFLVDLEKNISPRFPVYFPIREPDDNNMGEFESYLKNLLKNYFKKNQNNGNDKDIFILIELFKILIKGAFDNIKFNRITFYTEDKDFRDNILNFKQNFKNLDNQKFSDWINDALSRLDFKKAYDL